MKSGIERSRMKRFASLLPSFVLCISAFGQGTTPQQINLLPIADQRYGVAPFQVIALASSYLPVTITTTGPVTLNGRWLTVTGVGTVTVSAHQAGNTVYAPADAEEQFTILPAEPVVQAQPATIVYGTPFDPSIFNASATAVPAADPAADVPTVTSQFDTSQITSGSSVTVPYNSPLLRYESSPMIEAVTANGREGLIPDPTMVVDHYYKVAFTCDCQRFEFAIQSRTANYRLWVDGSWTNADTEPLADDSPRTLFYQVAFPDKRPRQIKVMLDEDTPFFGVNAAASDTISASQVPLGKRAIIYGDSLTTPVISEPTLPPTQPGYDGSGYPQVLGEYFNWDWWESGLIGSGFTSGGVGHLTFVQRALTDICGRNPDLVVLFGGLADANSTEQSIQQGATDFLSEVNGCLPGTPIYLLGPQAPSTNVAAAMAAAAALFPTTVDFGGAAPQFWVYGDRSDPTTGNAYLYLGDLNDNGGHPTPLGHDFFAEEVAVSILGFSPSLAPQAFNLFAPAPAIGSFAYSEAENVVLGAGDHQISITFTPADAVNYAVVTQPVLLTVNRASSSLGLTTSATNILAGGKLTLTASVSPQITGVPTGTVTFTADGQPLGNAPLDASGSAAFTTAGLAPGTHSISASYAGDGNFLSAPPPLPVKIIVIGPTAQLSATKLQFGTIPFGTTETLPLTITNIGGGTLTVSPSISAKSYTITGSTCAGGLTTGQNCTLQVEFSPITIATHDDTLTLQTNGSTNPTVSLQGVGDGLTATGGPLDFGAVPYGSSAILTLTITNHGVPGTLMGGTATLGPSYSIVTTAQNTCLAGVTRGHSCTLSVQFTPDSVGGHNGELTWTPTGGVAPITIGLIGSASGLTVSSSPLNFGTIASGSTSVLPLTIRNYELPGTVTIGTSVSGHSYKILTNSQNTCLAGISSGQSCTLPVEFDPSSVGGHGDLLTLTPSAAGAAPIPVGLEGTAAP